MSVVVSTLPSGLRIATDTIPHAKSITLQVWVKVGSRNETPEQNGVSHFLEHMAFKGTKRRTAKEIAEAFDNIGGHFNAYTSRERTVYYARVLEHDLPVAFDILADILQDSVFDEEEINRERNVILQEIAQSVDTPDDLIFDFFQDSAYPNQSLGRNILGTEALVSSFTRQQIIDYTATYYTVDNITIVAAGNLDHSRFSQLVTQYFDHLPKSQLPTREPARYVGGDRRQEKDLEQVHLTIGFESISYHDPRIYTQQLLSIIFGGGMSSRLFQEVREIHGLAYSVYSFSSCYDDTGMFGIYAGTSDTQLLELLPLLSKELQKMHDPVSDQELLRAKTQARSAILMAHESTHSRAEDLGMHLTWFDRHIPIEEQIAHIEAVTKGDISALLAQIVSTSSPTIGALGKIATLPPYESIVEQLRKGL